MPSPGRELYRQFGQLLQPPGNASGFFLGLPVGAVDDIHRELTTLDRQKPSQQGKPTGQDGRPGFREIDFPLFQIVGTDIDPAMLPGDPLPAGTLPGHHRIVDEIDMGVPFHIESL
jgi:hypothetical protein